MKVVLPAGTQYELGDLETGVTVSLTDYSRRETDTFGVTTVVKRGFARRMSVKLKVPFASVDSLQRRLAALRATEARWAADERFAATNFEGYYKEFDIDLSVPPVSWCTLTVDGLAANDDLPDPGGDPAADGDSTLRLLAPVAMTDAMLVSSTVVEEDAPLWGPGTAFPLGFRVRRAGNHRVYESVIAGNIGNDPIGAGAALWIDVGPTNRWAMFDQALGTATTAAGNIFVQIRPGPVNALALLDVVGSTVRVVYAGYDRTLPAGELVLFEMPEFDGAIAIIVNGPGQVSIGGLMAGRIVGLGVTEANPTAGIADYSRKDVDDFGEVTLVERGWAKRMTAKALIRTDAIDTVFGRIANQRATPCLWMGQSGSGALTVYGFFKDFSIELGENVSKLSLSIEGLSTAAPLAPLTVDWPNVGDPTGTRPDDNADVTGENTSKDTDAVGGRPAGQVVSELDQLALDAAAAQTAIGALQMGAGELLAEIQAAQQDIVVQGQDILANATSIAQLVVTTESQGALIQQAQTAASNALGDIAILKTQVNAGGGNLLTNTDFATGSAGWVSAASAELAGAVEFAVNLPSDGAWHPAEVNALTIHQVNATAEGYAEWSQTYAAEPGKIFEGSAWYAMHRAPADAYMLFYDVNDGLLPGGGGTGNLPAAPGGRSLDDFERLAFKTGAAPAGTAKARLFLRKFATNEGGDSWAWFLQPQVAETTAEAASPQRYSPGGAKASVVQQAEAISAVQGQYASLATTVSAQGASVGELWTASNTQAGQLAAYGLRLDTADASISQQAQALTGLDQSIAQVSQTVATQGASIETNAQAISTANSNYAGLSTTVSAQGVTVGQHAQAISAVENGVALVYGRAALMVDTGGRAYGIEIAGNQQTGGVKLHGDYLSIGSDSGGARFEYSNGNIRTYYDNGQLSFRAGGGF